MEKSKKNRLYSLIGGSCLCVYFVYRTYNSYSLFNGSYSGDIMIPSNIINFIALPTLFLLLGLLLIVGKKNPLFLIPPILEIFCHLYMLSQITSNSIIGLPAGPEMYKILVDGTLIFLIVINVFPSMQQYANMTNIVCFIPFALLLTERIYHWLIWGYFDSNNSPLLFLGMFFELISLTGILFLGLWFKETIDKDIVIRNDIVVNNQNSSLQSNKILSGADSLKMYKELLDSGIITQEDFNIKKNEILNQ